MSEEENTNEMAKRMEEEFSESEDKEGQNYTNYLEDSEEKINQGNIKQNASPNKIDQTPFSYKKADDVLQTNFKLNYANISSNNLKGSNNPLNNEINIRNRITFNSKNSTKFESNHNFNTQLIANHIAGVAHYDKSLNFSGSQIPNEKSATEGKKVSILEVKHSESNELNDNTKIIFTIKSYINIDKDPLSKSAIHPKEKLDKIFWFCEHNDFMVNIHEREYGKYWHYEKDGNNEKHKISNMFIKSNPELIDYALYFDKDVPSFIAKRIIRIKNRMFSYVVALINKLIINKKMQLTGVDYNTLIKAINTKFNLELFESKLYKIFIFYQVKDAKKDQNLEVIEYIRQNANTEILANFILDFTFEDLWHLFIADQKNGLERYLFLLKENAEKIIKGNIPKIKAIIEIDKLLCLKLHDYFNQVTPRATP